MKKQLFWGIMMILMVSFTSCDKDEFGWKRYKKGHIGITDVQMPDLSTALPVNTLVMIRAKGFTVKDEIALESEAYSRSETVVIEFLPNIKPLECTEDYITFFVPRYRAGRFRVVVIRNKVGQDIGELNIGKEDCGLYVWGGWGDERSIWRMGSFPWSMFMPRCLLPETLPLKSLIKISGVKPVFGLLKDQERITIVSFNPEMYDSLKMVGYKELTDTRDLISWGKIGNDLCVLRADKEVKERTVLQLLKIDHETGSQTEIGTWGKKEDIQPFAGKESTFIHDPVNGNLVFIAGISSNTESGPEKECLISLNTKSGSMKERVLDGKRNELFCMNKEVGLLSVREKDEEDKTYIGILNPETLEVKREVTELQGYWHSPVYQEYSKLFYVVSDFKEVGSNENLLGVYNPERQTFHSFIFGPYFYGEGIVQIN